MLEEQGHRIPRASGRIDGTDLIALETTPQAQATWFDTQRKVLASLPAGPRHSSSGAASGRQAALTLLDQ